jgi:translation initiation factor 3 subunit J
MKDMDIRKIASMLTASANEKQKAAKDALKKKKSKKPNAVVRADDFDGASYNNDNYGGDYDDFM